MELPPITIRSMADLHKHCAERGATPDRFQIVIDLDTSIHNAVEIDKCMRPGVLGAGFRVFNPEVVRLKVEAEAACRSAIAKVELDLDDIDKQIEKTRSLKGEIDLLFAPGPVAAADKVYLGPGINNRALPYEHVIYPEGALLPEVDVLQPRRLSKKRKLLSRGIDADSQMQFWNLNYDALIAKEKAQVAYRDAIAANIVALEVALIREESYIGAGYTDYAFRY